MGGGEDILKISQFLARAAAKQELPFNKLGLVVGGADLVGAAGIKDFRQ